MKRNLSWPAVSLWGKVVAMTMYPKCTTTKQRNKPYLKFNLLVTNGDGSDLEIHTYVMKTAMITEQHRHKAMDWCSKVVVPSTPLSSPLPHSTMISSGAQSSLALYQGACIRLTGTQARKEANGNCMCPTTNSASLLYHYRGCRTQPSRSWEK